MMMNSDDKRKSILVIEDDEAMSQLISLYLEHGGFRALAAFDGASGLKMASDQDPALVILDLNLPGMDGSDVCRSLRENSHVPIIMVTARVDQEDRLAGLDLGADDYVTKPFAPRELMARIRAVLRRTLPAAGESENRNVRISVGPYVVEQESRTVEVNGQELKLTPTEYRLLVCFLEANRRTLNRIQIIEKSIGYDFVGFDRTVDTHISNLRRKLETATGGERHLNTVYGVGYRFEAS